MHQDERYEEKDTGVYSSQFTGQEKALAVKDFPKTGRNGALNTGHLLPHYDIIYVIVPPTDGCLSPSLRCEDE